MLLTGGGLVEAGHVFQSRESSRRRRRADESITGNILGRVGAPYVIYIEKLGYLAQTVYVAKSLSVVPGRYTCPN